jgi:hypothetical protein
MRVEGSPPWFPNIAAHMDPAPDLLNRIAAEYAPIAAEHDPGIVWWGLHNFAIDKLVGLALQGQLRDNLREAYWVVYATGYWASLQQQRMRGVPSAIINLGVPIAPPSEMLVADLAAKHAVRAALLAGNGGALLDAIPGLLREAPGTGLLHGACYNAAATEASSEAPPLGVRSASLAMTPGMVRVNPRDFMRFDYGIPAPDWLRAWRATYEASVRAHPETYERILAADGDLSDLRALWREAHAWGYNNWGKATEEKPSQSYFDSSTYWAVVFNFAAEAVAMAAFTALLEHDAEAAKRAITGNALLLGSWGSFVMGLTDPVGQLPDFVPA